jgi:hypothetical protein
MRMLIGCVVAILSVTTAVWTRGTDSSAPDRRVPVLVELFTSEGCSSCPPADAFLQKLDAQPVAGAEMIVLSEHVDYWNSIGWKDPYSAHFYSDRQSVYGRRFDLNSVYTPQMIVDGSSEFTGSDAALADKAFVKALGKPKLAVRLSNLSSGGTNVLQAHIETGALAASFGVREAEIYSAVALNRAQSHVSHGENAGRTLEHVAVVKSLVKVGTFRQGQAFSKDVQLKLDPGADWHNLRLIAFVQEPGQGRVIGAALETLDATVAKAN